MLEDDLPSVLSKIVSDSNSDNFKVQLNTVLILVSEKRLTLPQFIEAIRPYIDDKDPDWRKKAMKLLAEVMRRKSDFRVSTLEASEILRLLTTKVLDVPMAG